MLTDITFNGVNHKINNQNIIDVGGESTVIFLSNTIAVKLLHNPTSERIAKIQKLIELEAYLPDNICCPISLGFHKKKPIGFSMKRLSSSRYKSVKLLSRKDFRKNNQQIGSKVISDIFIHKYKTLEKLHSFSPLIVVGDYNDSNCLFDIETKTSFLIDVDSFQFDKFLCEVGTEEFLDPTLYDLDLSKKQYFTKLTDWYAFWTMFIKSLTLVHPYGGNHKVYRSIPKRAKHGITFLDSEINYPKMGFSPDILNDELKTVMERLFKNQERTNFPIDIIKNYQRSLILCSSCGIEFPNSRKSCPSCSTITRQEIHREIRVDKHNTNKINRTLILETHGKIVWHKSINDNIYAIEKIKSSYIFHKYIFSKKYQANCFIFEENGQCKFDMFKNILVVSKEHEEAINLGFVSDQIVWFNWKNNDDFRGRSAFCCSGSHLFRLLNGFLYQGSVKDPGVYYTEKQIHSFMKNQTWICASSLDNIVLGCQQYFDRTSFFLMRFWSNAQTKLFNIKMPEMEVGESIIEISAKFSFCDVLLLIKTEVKGATFTRVCIINFDGRVISTFKTRSLSSDIYKNIHGKAFIKTNYNGPSIIFHPTDDGIVKETIGENELSQQELLSETEPFVADGCSLSVFGSGMLVVNSNSINYLVKENS